MRRYRRGLNVEKKYFDKLFVNGSNGFPVSGGWTGNAAVIKSMAAADAVGNTGMSTGDGPSNRDGRQVTITSLHFRLRLIADDTDGTNSKDAGGSIHARVMVILDKQANGATATQSDIFSDTRLLVAYNNLNNSYRFRKLYDKVITLNTTGARVTDDKSISYERFIKFDKMCSIPLIYNGNTGAIAEVRSNNLLLVIMPNYNSTVNLNFSAECLTRLRFTDA